MHEIADFRSDKVARPTPEMLAAMASCHWGDGQTDDGPDVRRLESLACALTGKPAALFLVSGTLANELAVKAHTSPGDQVLLDEASHIACVEHGAPAAFSGVLTRTLPADRGMMSLDRVRQALEGHFLHTSLVSIENTHNFLGGRVLPLDYMQDLYRLVASHEARVHLDGARILNASAKTGVPVVEYARCADSLMFCLSKGLCAPAGSILCGQADFIGRAGLLRSSLGAFPKQAAPLAAAGLVALSTLVDRLSVDHENAALLARQLRALKATPRHLLIEEPETNMVFLTLKSVNPEDFLRECARGNILAYHLGSSRLRFVTHRDIDPNDVHRSASVIGDLLNAKGSASC